MTVTAHRPVLVVDFGAQYAQLIARRVREAHVFSEIVPSTMAAAEMAEKNPAAIVLSGGPSSVYAPGAPALDPGVFDLGVPIFGICYGFQAMAQSLGGEVAKTGLSEFGGTTLTVTDQNAALFAGIRENVAGRVRLLESDLHINDPQFAAQAVSLLREMLASR